MNLINLTEKWDGVLYSMINVVAKLLYILHYPKWGKILGRNRELKDKHKGGRCFIVLNGPSINEHDLSSLKNEVVFATNFFYRAPLCKIVEPDYYCWLDSKVLTEGKIKEIFPEMLEACPKAKFIFNIKGVNVLGLNSNINYVYPKTLPSIFGIQYDLSKTPSNVGTVAYLAILAAMYMGFEKIYLLGLDFEPTGFAHFQSLGANTECVRPGEKSSKLEVAGEYWGYTCSQYQSYYLQDLAVKKNCQIINLNENSYIRAFPFAKYEDII